MNNPKFNKRIFLTSAIVVLIAIAGLFFINTGKAEAEMSNVAQGNVTNDEPLGNSVMPSLFKMIAALVLVVACIYISIYFLKKTMGRKFSGNRNVKALEVLETTFLAPKKSISIVRIADRAVLVGVTEQQISVLTEMNKEETEQLLMIEETNQRDVSSRSFKEIFDSAAYKIKELSQKRNTATVKS